MIHFYHTGLPHSLNKKRGTYSYCNLIRNDWLISMGGLSIFEDKLRRSKYGSVGVADCLGGKEGQDVIHERTINKNIKCY